MYEFRLPDVGEGVAEAEVVRWLVNEGDSIEQDQPVVEVQTDKAVVELSSPVKGVIQPREWPEGSVAPVGEVLFVVNEEIQEKSDDVKLTIQRRKRALATPSVRRLAKEMDIDLQLVTGTGRDGRILEVDLQKAVSSTIEEGASLEPAFEMVATMPKEVISEESITLEAPVMQKISEIEELSPSPIRRVIGERLLYSVTQKPHAIHFDELDVEGMVSWRTRMKNDNNIPLTFTAILLKLISFTLQQHPLFNAHYDEKTQKIHKFHSLSIGIATDTPKGLLVPVIHEVEKKSMVQLSSEITQLTESARSGKCTPEQMKGSTFTISNAGTLGGKWAAPIINPPEMAILAIHPIEQRPIVKESIVQPGWRMNVSLAFDHRVLDGADAIRFTQTLGAYTTDPGRLLHQLV